MIIRILTMLTKFYSNHSAICSSYRTVQGLALHQRTKPNNKTGKKLWAGMLKLDLVSFGHGLDFCNNVNITNCEVWYSRV